MEQNRTIHITSTNELAELLKLCEISFEYPQGMEGITRDLYDKGSGVNFELEDIRSTEVLEVYKGFPEHVKENIWQLVGYTFLLMRFDEETQNFANWLKMVVIPWELALYEESRQ